MADVNPLDTELLLWSQQTLADTVERAQALPVEASHRRFYRLWTAQNNTVVLMVSPPELERNEAFVELSALFCHHRVPVPRVLAHTDRWFLMTDLGQTELAEVYQGEHKGQAVSAALSMLGRLHGIVDARIEPYTEQRITTELQLFSEWYCAQLCDHPIDQQQFEQAYRPLVEAMLAQPQTCVHRDYHCRNLLYQNGQLGIVDFQDALHGPILYDPASLLRDCYYTFDEADIDRHLSEFVGHTPHLDGMQQTIIKQWFDYTAIQRQLKAIGIFARLSLRDGKDSHLQYINPLIVRLRALAGQYANLSPLLPLLVVR